MLFHWSKNYGWVLTCKKDGDYVDGSSRLHFIWKVVPIAFLLLGIYQTAWPTPRWSPAILMALKSSVTMWLHCWRYITRTWPWMLLNIKPEARCSFTTLHQTLTPWKAREVSCGICAKFQLIWPQRQAFLKGLEKRKL